MTEENHFQTTVLVKTTALLDRLAKQGQGQGLCLNLYDISSRKTLSEKRMNLRGEVMLSVCVCLSVCSQGVRHVTINHDTFDLIIQAVRTSPHLQLVAYGEQVVRTILECFLVVQYC